MRAGSHYVDFLIQLLLVYWINKPCTVKYRYIIFWHRSNYYPHTRMKVSANLVSSVSRQIIYAGGPPLGRRWLPTWVRVDTAGRLTVVRRRPPHLAVIRRRRSWSLRVTTRRQLFMRHPRVCSPQTPGSRLESNLCSSYRFLPLNLVYT